MILMALMAIKSPQKDLLIDASHVSRQSVLAKISSRSTSNHYVCLSQTSFGHISTNSSTILMVLKATKSPQKDLLIDSSHVLRQSILAEILSRSTGNYYVTIY